MGKAQDLAGRAGRSTRNNGKGAGFGAFRRLGCSDHGDAIDMEPTSRFVSGKGDAVPLKKAVRMAMVPFGTVSWTPALETTILFSYLDNFATPPIPVACKQRAEWTSSTKPQISES